MNPAAVGVTRALEALVAAVRPILTTTSDDPLRAAVAQAESALATMSAFAHQRAASAKPGMPPPLPQPPQLEGLAPGNYHRYNGRRYRVAHVAASPAGANDWLTEHKGYGVLTELEDGRAVIVALNDCGLPVA